ncbi:sigma-70 family RNA polymerase sigma factor [Clostridium aestuarii]|uniref:RNA polymerase sigma factor SigI n=1 Tax=Clostridium aestuarii TaxID=338193 RepID=A0ABT4D0S3_9CLOT|nr:sigma-70 family RNA polymerase sigma factor [Clostridium aestuarii]MCY6484841.1 sigma-70 family RNA polymerase sigma factor [Clostridium aestuarii]
MDPKLLSKENRNSFIESNKNFIYKIAYKICKRNLTWQNDDELSIALIAFNKACNTYNEKKGNFFSYTAMLIKNSLIDFFRKNQNTPYLIFDNTKIAEDDDNSNYIDFKSSINKYEIDCENQNRAQEIALFSQELKKYKLNFSELIKSSPSHIDTRNNLLNLALSCLKNENILKYIKDKRLLPISQISLLTNTNKKHLEKWRRYLIVLILILSSDEYPYIKSYLNIKVGEKFE